METIYNYAYHLNNMEKNPYFKNLAKIPGKKRYVKNQLCFFYVIENWAKVLGKMVAIVPSNKQRAVFVENLYYHHGNGVVDNSHVNTFVDLLDLLVFVTDQDIMESRQVDCVVAFNKELNMIVDSNNWIYITGVLGMIEYLYVTVSKNMNNYLSNFLDQHDIKYYSSKEAHNEIHAKNLFDLLMTDFTEVNVEKMKNGMERGHKMFYELYEKMNDLL